LNIRNSEEFGIRQDRTGQDRTVRERNTEGNENELQTI